MLSLQKLVWNTAWNTAEISLENGPLILDALQYFKQYFMQYFFSNIPLPMTIISLSSQLQIRSIIVPCPPLRQPPSSQRWQQLNNQSWILGWGGNDDDDNTVSGANAVKTALNREVGGGSSRNINKLLGGKKRKGEIKALPSLGGVLKTATAAFLSRVHVHAVFPQEMYEGQKYCQEILHFKKQGKNVDRMGLRVCIHLNCLLMNGVRLFNNCLLKINHS